MPHGAKSLLLSRTDPDTKDRLVWKWIKGAATTQTDFGNPTTSASYALCVYDNTGLVGTMDVPPDSNKWVAIGLKGYKYTDLTATEDGAFKLKLKGNDSAPKSKALVKARGMDQMDPLNDGPLVLLVKVTGQQQQRHLLRVQLLDHEVEFEREVQGQESVINGPHGLCSGAVASRAIGTPPAARLIARTGEEA